MRRRRLNHRRGLTAMEGKYADDVFRPLEEGRGSKGIGCPTRWSNSSGANQVGVGKDDDSVRVNHRGKTGSRAGLRLADAPERCPASRLRRGQAARPFVGGARSTRCWRSSVVTPTTPRAGPWTRPACPPRQSRASSTSCTGHRRARCSRARTEARHPTLLGTSCTGGQRASPQR